MFTLSFHRQRTDEKTVICCARYSQLANGDRQSFWLYPTHKSDNPVLIDLHLDEDDNTYYEVFVTNESGKTIDRARAYSPPDGTTPTHD